MIRSSGAKKNAVSMLPILLASSYPRLSFPWIILNLLSRYLWRKNPSCSFHCIHFLLHSLADCFMLNASRDSAKMLVWQQQQTKEILILIRCPFRSVHKINACILSLNSTFLLLFSLVPFHIYLICCCFSVMWWSNQIKSRGLSDHWTSIKIDCVHQLLFGCEKSLTRILFIHPRQEIHAY